ncbi:MAG: 30S ribosomal protein S16 [Minisyncoccia bacterium]|jgi:small subunit ribosomal protein S16
MLFPMLAIKLQRVGKKHQPSYRLVVAEKKSKMAAPPVEDLGTYSPFTKAAAFDKERIAYWVKMGAQPTVTVYNLLVEQGVLLAPKAAVKMKKKAVPAAADVAANVPAATANAATAPAAEEKTAETPVA